MKFSQIVYTLEISVKFEQQHLGDSKKLFFWFTDRFKILGWMVNFLKVDYLKSDKCRGGVLFEYKAAFCKIRLDLTDSLTATQKLLGKTIFFFHSMKAKISEHCRKFTMFLYPIFLCLCKQLYKYICAVCILVNKIFLCSAYTILPILSWLFYAIYLHNIFTACSLLFCGNQ